MLLRFMPLRLSRKTALSHRLPLFDLRQNLRWHRCGICWLCEWSADYYQRRRPFTRFQSLRTNGTIPLQDLFIQCLQPVIVSGTIISGYTIEQFSARRSWNDSPLGTFETWNSHVFRCMPTVLSRHVSHRWPDQVQHLAGIDNHPQPGVEMNIFSLPCSRCWRIRNKQSSAFLLYT